MSGRRSSLIVTIASVSATVHRLVATMDSRVTHPDVASHFQFHVPRERLLFPCSNDHSQLENLAFSLCAPVLDIGFDSQYSNPR
ncbi:hypothetical protein BCR34DRAFT_559704 [Clohesyomyces aquaticus]|uniref:Uncharacterized protein n=1 Tax=Clohesyomyces aquaticus TaxID=1231657 RepID=A0A1Y1ZXK8_9PLEO|nr:hypothetical protein BCR34DRAFT_559704 [Clohesyomyces aquaticus]